MKININYTTPLKSNITRQLIPVFAAKKKENTDNVSLSTKTNKVEQTAKPKQINKTINFTIENQKIFKEIAKSFDEIHAQKKAIFEDIIKVIHKEEGVVYTPGNEYHIKYGIDLGEKQINLVSSSKKPEEIKVIIESNSAHTPQNTFTIDKSLKVHSPKHIDVNKELEPIFKNYIIMQNSSKEKAKILELYKEAKTKYEEICKLDREIYLRELNHTHREDVPYHENKEFFDIGYSRSKFDGYFWIPKESLLIDKKTREMKYYFADDHLGKGANILATPSPSQYNVFDVYFFDKKNNEFLKHLLVNVSASQIIEFDDDLISLPRKYYKDNNNRLFPNYQKDEPTKIFELKDIDEMYKISKYRDFYVTTNKKQK